MHRKLIWAPLAEKMKVTLKYSILILTFFAIGYIALGQNKAIQNNNIIGKWKLNIMRDTAGYAFDIINSGEGMPDIFPFFKIKKNGKVILSHGKTKYKAKWNLLYDSISFRLKNNQVLSYKIHSLKENELVIEYVEVLGKNRELLGYVYYKRQ
jgi:hypothetical protein